jgi:hypothetical protein
MFRALEALSAAVPKAYEAAGEAGDLHPGDLHLIPVDGETCSRFRLWTSIPWTKALPAAVSEIYESSDGAEVCISNSWKVKVASDLLLTSTYGRAFFYQRLSAVF